MVLAVGEILFEFIPRTVFAHVLVLLVFEMYSLISSLVVMRDCEAGALMGTFATTPRFKYGRFKRQTGLHAVKKTVRLCFGRTYVRRACFAL